MFISFLELKSKWLPDLLYFCLCWVWFSLISIQILVSFKEICVIRLWFSYKQEEGGILKFSWSSWKIEELPPFECEGMVVKKYVLPDVQRMDQLFNWQSCLNDSQQQQFLFFPHRSTIDGLISFSWISSILDYLSLHAFSLFILIMPRLPRVLNRQGEKFLQLQIAYCCEVLQRL